MSRRIGLTCGRLEASQSDSVCRDGRLAAAYEHVAGDCGCEFLNAGRVTDSSAVDGVHLNVDHHAALGRAIAEVAAKILSSICCQSSPSKRWSASLSSDAHLDGTARRTDESRHPNGGRSSGSAADDDSQDFRVRQL